MGRTQATGTQLRGFSNTPLGRSTSDTCRLLAEASLRPIALPLFEPRHFHLDDRSRFGKSSSVSFRTVFPHLNRQKSSIRTKVLGRNVLQSQRGARMKTARSAGNRTTVSCRRKAQGSLENWELAAKASLWRGQGEDPDGCDEHPCLRESDGFLPVFGQSPPSAETCKSAFDDPAPCDDDEAFGVIGALDDFDFGNFFREFFGFRLTGARFVQ